jgi:hypothetical protein
MGTKGGFGLACAACLLGLAAAAQAKPLACRRVAAWDAERDLVVYELPRDCDLMNRSKGGAPNSIYELRRISTGVAVDIADCEISYTIGGAGPVAHRCDLEVLVHDRKPFTRLRPGHRGELLSGDSAADLAWPKLLRLPGGDVDLAALDATITEVRGTAAEVLVVLSERGTAPGDGAVETLLRVPAATRAGTRPQQELIAQAGAAAMLTRGAVAPFLLRAARTWGPLEIGAVSKTFCSGPDRVERLEGWRRVAAELAPAEQVAVEAALAKKGCYAPLDPKTYDAAGPQMRVALEWLDAVRRRDRAPAVELMAVPFVARGWWDNRGHDPEYAACGVKNQAPPRAWPDTHLRVDDPAALPAAFDCMMRAESKPYEIPELANGRWRPDRGDPWDYYVGAIFPIEPSQVSKHVSTDVRRRTAEARELARDGTLLQAVSVDNDGSTLSMLLVVADGHVRAFFAQSFFEE